MGFKFTGSDFHALRFISITIFALVISRSAFAKIPPQNARTEILKLEQLLDGSTSDFSDEPLGDFLSITIPLKRVGRLFLVEANIDDQVGNLIFDTGSSGLVLNRTYFRKNVMISKGNGGGITGSIGDVYCTNVDRLQISDLYYENVKADVTDLGHIENRRGVKILGLFGLNMIKNFEIVIDINNSELQLNRIDKKGNRLNPNSKVLKFDIVQKVENVHNMMFIKGKIGGKQLNFCLDTGAEINAINSHSSRKVLNTITIDRRSNLGGTGSASAEVLYGTMNDFVVGDKLFDPMKTIVTNLDNMCEAYDCNIDGMLGYDFFEKGIICINFVKEELGICLRKGEKNEN